MRMMHRQWLAGSLVMLGAGVGAAVTAPWAARKFAPPASVADTGKPDGGHKRTCITLDGKRFEWSYPNPPFGTRSCSD
jgi:hypothetical protein